VNEPVVGETAVRVRFCPSPTGNPHVGLIRTALFNWAFARRHNGTLVLRIEDTDAARDTQESYRLLLDSLRWLGMDWDEGPEVGGPHGPYRQSERTEIYTDVVRLLRESGHAYECFCSTEELTSRREAARAAGRSSGYDGRCRELATQQRAAYRRQGRVPVLRLRMPDTPITFSDLVRGELTFAPENVTDYAIVRASGEPLYTLVNPVDDALMEISHVLRGEDLLSSTPRQVALYGALGDIGVAQGAMPQFGHLPYVMGQGNKKLSKRDPEASLSLYRERGFLPEGLVNYLALLGWSMGDDRELFTMDEMAAAFDISRVNASPARFDLAKCEAINAMKVRALTPTDLAERLVPYLRSADLVDEPLSSDQRRLLDGVTPLIQERITVLTEAVDMVRFLFVDDAELGVAPIDDPAGVLVTARESLSAVAAWVTPDIEQALRIALIDGLGLKPKLAFGPVRVAVTGSRVSPPLFESVELLGRERTLARLAVASGR
jgi:glutamyl-tRNA synthetase